ncbi:MAG: DUF5696 domain-containing protein [Armatimonadota bacterium]
MSIKSALSAFIIASSILMTGMLPAQPLLTPDAPVMKLDEIGIYTIGYQYNGKTPQTFPVGWSGMFEEKTGISCLQSGTLNGKQAFLLHCPWRNGTGTTFQEFSFKIPNIKKVTLRGYTAMLTDVIGKTDGASFKIYINGRKVLDVFQIDDIWKPYKIDLTSFAGKVVNIKFETGPGPKNDSSYDYSLWGDRELVLEGYKPIRKLSTPPPPLSLSIMSSARNRSTVPLSGYKGNTDARLIGDTAVFKYSGKDGTLEYRWSRPSKPSDPPFGSISLSATPERGDKVNVSAALTADLQWSGKAEPGDSKWGQGRDGTITCIRQYKVDGKASQFKITGRIINKSLVFNVESNTGLVTSLESGTWGPVMRKTPVTTPYYSGKPLHLNNENIFVNSFLDWTSSSATTHNGNRAFYQPLTDETRNPLNETIIYTAAWHLAEVFPNIPNPQSPFMKQVGNKIVLDIWGGRYTDIAKSLEDLHDYGITNCAVIIHDWQRSGYDNGLPMHYPANPVNGGDEGMKILVDTARRLGYLISLHENYVDYYTNYDYYDENDIALDSDGNKQKAWYNEGTKMQSFAVKPNSIMRLAATQSPEIHRRYGTNAVFLDVHSSAPPFFHIDQRTGEEGAGMFNQTWKVHQQLWDFERRTHEGPVFGEGASHWYWSGFLDGVEAQFRDGLPEREGMKAPLMVDFDLLRMHPLQVNHGMGYYERWWKDIKWGSQPPIVVLDQYRMQEAAYGHAGFLSKDTWRTIPLAWLEHNLLTPVMERYAEAKPSAIAYEINGKWVDGTEAAKSGTWQRVKIKYDNGLTVTANTSKTIMNTGAHKLPQFGWVAEGAGVTAYTALRDGVVADYAETADSVFVNARDITTWNSSGINRVRPELNGIKQISPRTIEFSYVWNVNDTLPGDYSSFVHFSLDAKSDNKENILFQQDHMLPKPTSEWKSGEKIIDGIHTLKLSDDIADGDYKWHIGLVDPVKGDRIAIEGNDDGHRRIFLGTLHVKGAKISFTPDKSSGVDIIELYSRNLNTQKKVIDFGTVRTNGSVMIRREGDEWVMQTLPRDGNFILEMNSKRFPKPSFIHCTDGKNDIKPSESANGWWRIDLNGSSQYRWKSR